jgi:hypothetical protein
MVKVLVGPTEQEFLVYKNKVCNASPFLNAAFNGNFKEGVEGLVRLPDDDVGVFDHFLQWVYTREVQQELG